VWSAIDTEMHEWDMKHVRHNMENNIRLKRGNFYNESRRDHI